MELLRLSSSLQAFELEAGNENISATILLVRCTHSISLCDCLIHFYETLSHKKIHHSFASVIEIVHMYTVVST